MRTSTMIGLLLLASCDSSIGIAPDKSIEESADITQDAPADDSAIEEEVVEEEPEDVPVEEEEETEEPLTDFLQPGPFGVTVESRTANVTNCSSMDYSVYTPATSDPPVVILGHGFARGADSMTGWAEHLSTWGVEVLLPTLCHYNVWTGVDHEMNGQNMKELAVLHGTSDIIYAGHSAGGLAAIIAASQDSSALGVLGLDATDTEGVPGVPDFIGQEYASNVTCRAYSIVGEPSNCNSDNNGLTLFSMMPDYRAVRVTSSDHCDFESPTDFVCEASCENSSTTFSDEEIRPAIVTLGTAAVIALAGLSADGDLVWTDLSFSEDLIHELE